VCFDWVGGEVDEKKRETEGWPEEKGHVAAAAGELGGELRARAGAWNWPVRSEIGRKTAIPIGSGGCQAKGEMQRHGAAAKLRPTFWGPP
jgi:hypothetical protein